MRVDTDAIVRRRVDDSVLLIGEVLY